MDRDTELLYAIMEGYNQGIRDLAELMKSQAEAGHISVPSQSVIDILDATRARVSCLLTDELDKLMNEIR
jgi:hypothetical protein